MEGGYSGDLPAMEGGRGDLPAMEGGYSCSKVKRLSGGP